LPTAVACSAVAELPAPHSVLRGAGPSLHSGVGSARAGDARAMAATITAAACPQPAWRIAEGEWRRNNPGMMKW
jgi:hypothetical protein